MGEKDHTSGFGTIAIDRIFRSFAQVMYLMERFLAMGIGSLVRFYLPIMQSRREAKYNFFQRHYLRRQSLRYVF